VKIRVFLIICFYSAFQIISAQKAPTIKNDVVYYLSSIFEGGKKNNLCRDKGHIVFNTNKKTAACFTSCSFMQLQFSQKGTAFGFTITGQPKDPCPDMLLGIEEDLKNNLPKVNSYQIKGKDLIFFSNKDTLFVFHEK